MLHLVADSTATHHVKHTVIGQLFNPVDKRVMLGSVANERVGIKRDKRRLSNGIWVFIRKHRARTVAFHVAFMLHSCCAEFLTANGGL
jgi:hypothetical protein